MSETDQYSEHSILSLPITKNSWWRNQMETFSTLLAICAGNSPVTGEFPAQRPVTRSFDVFFICAWNKRLSKQWWGWWFETPLWRHCNVFVGLHLCITLAPRRCSCNLQSVTFKLISRIDILTFPVKLSSGECWMLQDAHNGLVLPGNNPLP